MIHKIHSDEALRVNLELIGHMYEAIISLKRDIAPQNFKNYLIFAEGPIEEIRRLKNEIDEYLGINEAVAQAERDAAEEDALDMATVADRREESSRPLWDYLAESRQPPSGDSNVAPA